MAQDIDERRIGDYTVRIDRLLCVGFGDCVSAAPDVFVLDDQDIAAFRDADPHPDADMLREACDSCPVDALTLLGPDGVQVAP